MRVYVIGAGVSHTAGYPLGGGLLGALRQHVGEFPVSYREQWAELLGWLKDNANPDLRLAYAQERLEHIFTIMDLTVRLQDYAPLDALRRPLLKRSDAALNNAEHCIGFLKETKSAGLHRALLLKVLADYFDFKHSSERHPHTRCLVALDKFAKTRINDGDFLITFNYDALMERVLFHQGKWLPSDGYGFRVPLQASINDPAPVSEESKVTVLTLHGSVGWYPANSPSIDKGGLEGRVTSRSSDISSEQRLDPANQQHIVLDQMFLHNLGIEAFDSRFRWDTPHSPRVLIHPTFLKSFEIASFAALWRSAAQALRNADEVAVVAYSLPAEDSAALTLLQTNCDRRKVTIVNNSAGDCHRLRQLLAGDSGSNQCLSFEEWLDEGS